MRGREPGWQIVQARSAMADRLALMRALGFAAVYVNLDGYPTTEASPLTDAQVIAALDTELGPPALVQGPLRLYLLNGGPPGAQLAADARDPVWMRWASGFDQMYWIDDSISHRARADAAVELRNERATSRTVEVSFVIRADADAPPRDIEVTWPDGEVELIPFSGPAVAVSRSLSLAPGTSQLRLSVPDAPPRGFAYVLVDLAVVDASLVELLPPPPPTAVRALP
jgi:hypothetical protein